MGNRPKASFERDAARRLIWVRSVDARTVGESFPFRFDGGERRLRRFCSRHGDGAGPEGVMRLADGALEAQSAPADALAS